jgi:ATP-binding cassette subfamily B protein
VFLPFLEVLPLIAILAVLWLGSRSAIKGEITVGTLVAFTTYVSMLVWPMRVIGQRVGTLQQAVAAARRVVEVLHAQPAVVEGAGASPKQLRGHVRLDDVRFAYEPGRPVLDGLTIEIEPGTSLALVGETGAGKSTVAALLARFYDVDGGSVTIDGVDVRDLRLDDLRRSVATVFSETFLFTDTVRANIAYARPGASDDEIERAMRLAGAHDFVRRLPDGYDTMLGERGLSLSGGQRQRLAIARAIVADPAVLILDDATSAVDATKEHEIRSALGEVMHGRTTLVIAHRAATIALADRVAVIESGRVVEEGTHTELSRRSARYRSLLALEVAA